LIIKLKVKWTSNRSWKVRAKSPWSSSSRADSQPKKNWTKRL